MLKQLSIQSRKTSAAKYACTRRTWECPEDRDLHLEKQRTTQEAIHSQEMPMCSQLRDDQISE